MGGLLSQGDAWRDTRRLLKRWLAREKPKLG
jgi:hypothetical protein